MKNRMHVLATTAAVAAILGFSAGMAQAEVTLKAATSQPPKGGFLGDTLTVLGSALKEKTNGEITLKTFYSGALSSNERELAEMAQSGAVDIAVGATTYILGWAPSAKIFDLPYLYESVGHYKKVVQGEVGDFIKSEVEDDGVKLIAFVLPGFRSIFNNVRPIKTVADANGLKIRSMQSPVYVEMFKSMGMLPTPMPASELYTSLQLGTVDAGENDPASVVSWGWKDVIKYYSMDRHSISVNVVVMNKAKFDGFPPDTQKAILEAGRAAENHQIDYITGAWAQSMELIKKSGVQVNEVDDLKPFQDSVKHIVDQFDKEIGHGLVQKVRDAAK